MRGRAVALFGLLAAAALLYLVVPIVQVGAHAYVHPCVRAPRPYVRSHKYRANRAAARRRRSARSSGSDGSDGSVGEAAR